MSSSVHLISFLWSTMLNDTFDPTESPISSPKPDWGVWLFFYIYPLLSFLAKAQGAALWEVIDVKK